MNDSGRTIAEEEALTWLLGQPTGRIETTVADLARQWGWNRTKVLRRLKQWSTQGHIVRTLSSGGRSVITAIKGNDCQQIDVRNDLPNLAQEIVFNERVSAPVFKPERLSFDLSPSMLPRFSVRRFVSIVLSAIAAAIAWFGLQINAWYGETLGKTAEAGALLAGLSVSADILALILPTTARVLWVDRHRAAAGIAWGLWAMTILLALLATVGFAALNVSDTAATRSKIASERALLTERVERLRTERAEITETRPLGTLETELQRAQPGAAPVWRATSGCRDITLASSGEACATVLALRSALQTAQRRDALDATLLEAEQQLKGLPAISISDPQAEIGAHLINWVTLGAIKVTAEDIRTARIAGMSLMPQIAGLVLMLGTIIWKPRPERSA
jgi:hypothetical protein